MVGDGDTARPPPLLHALCSAAPAGQEMGLVARLPPPLARLLPAMAGRAQRGAGWRGGCSGDAWGWGGVVVHEGGCMGVHGCPCVNGDVGGRCVCTCAWGCVCVEEVCMGVVRGM